MSGREAEINDWINGLKHADARERAIAPVPGADAKCVASL